MNTTLSEVSRLDVSQVFWEVDDFCRAFEQQCLHHPQLPSMADERPCQSRLSRSEVMTIVIACQGSGYRTFKEFYALCGLPGWRH
ncbi:MAG: IS982 family transposase, partial [Cyanobacteria bacterium P01_C01_bin.120]